MNFTERAEFLVLLERTDVETVNGKIQKHLAIFAQLVSFDTLFLSLLFMVSSAIDSYHLWYHTFFSVASVVALFVLFPWVVSCVCIACLGGV